MRIVNEDELKTLVELPIIRACARKWELGRAERGPVFEGDPLEELYGELADALNYTDQLEIEGEEVDEIRERLAECAELARAIWKRRMGLEHA